MFADPQGRKRLPWANLWPRDPHPRLRHDLSRASEDRAYGVPSGARDSDGDACSSGYDSRGDGLHRDGGGVGGQRQSQRRHKALAPQSYRKLRIGWLIVLLPLIFLQCAGFVTFDAEYENARLLFLHGYLEKSQVKAQQGYKRFHDSHLVWALKFKLHRFSVAAENLANAEIRCQVSDELGCGDLLRARGVLALQEGEIPQAQQMFFESLSAARVHSERWLEATSLLGLSAASLQEDHYDEAVTLRKMRLEISGGPISNWVIRPERCNFFQMLRRLQRGLVTSMTKSNG
jgi:hypothetical protein